MGTRKDKLWSKHLNEVGLTFIDEKMGKSLNLVFSWMSRVTKTGEGGRRSSKAEYDKKRGHKEYDLQCSRLT
jgi:hypothetical protein